MKKIVIAVCAAAALLFAGYEAYYRLGLRFPFDRSGSVTAFATTDGTAICLERDGGPVPFELRGVNIGLTVPGARAGDFAIGKETYLRWLEQNQAMGANTVRVYTILQQDFYDAFYDYNTRREEEGREPLYLLHGVWVDEYRLNSYRDAFAEDILQTFIGDCEALVDVLHGRRTLSGLWRNDRGSGAYRRDVSPWVIGYLLGVEWNADTVAYTDGKFQGMAPYQGTYFSAAEQSTPFESLLAEAADRLVSYESKRYGQQRLVSFVNWPGTDPFLYPEGISAYFGKCALVDAERIIATGKLISGQFASYQVSPWYPDYINYVLNPVEGLEARWQSGSLWADKGFFLKLYESVGVRCEEALSGVPADDFRGADGRINTYYAYLRMLTRHHTMPVVISEFGVSSGRGISQVDWNTGRSDGNNTEREQGQALADCWRDIRAAGCAGGCVAWQDDWTGESSNTLHAVDLDSAPYWIDNQTVGQHFGLLAFEPDPATGAVVDGDLSEWSGDDIVTANGDMELSVRYDAGGLCFLIRKEDFDPETDVICLPVDVNPKVGGYSCQSLGAAFDRAADFVIVIRGREDSRVLVQERYDVLRAVFYPKLHAGYADAYLDPPAQDSPVFHEIRLLLQTAVPLLTGSWREPAQTFETGRLRYGNADPASPEFDSLADFIFSGDYVEIRIPWQLLNFSDPSKMMVHDDYYERYGVENLHIESIYVGIGPAEAGEGTIPMAELSLTGWGKKDAAVTERLKESYYILQECWTTT